MNSIRAELYDNKQIEDDFVKTMDELLLTIHPFKMIDSIGYFMNDPLKRNDFLDGVHDLADHMYKFWKSKESKGLKSRAKSIIRVHERVDNYKKNILENLHKQENEIETIKKQLSKKIDHMEDLKKELNKCDKSIIDEEDKAIENDIKYRKVINVLDGRIQSLHDLYQQCLKEMELKEKKNNYEVTKCNDQIYDLKMELAVVNAHLDNLQIRLPNIIDDCIREIIVLSDTNIKQTETLVKMRENILMEIRKSAQKPHLTYAKHFVGSSILRSIQEDSGDEDDHSIKDLNDASNSVSGESSF